MKKIIALGLLLLLVLTSVPFALAREHEDDSANEEETERKSKELSRGDKIRAERIAAKEAMLVKAREVREKLSLAKDEFKERREELKEEIKDSEERFKERREVIKEIREDFKEKRKELVAARQAFHEKRDEVKACRGDKSAECVDVREKAREHAKEFLAKAVQEALKVFNDIKARVSSSDIAEETKTRLLANLDERIERVKSVQAEVEALGDKSTSADYREAAKKIRSAWHDSKDLLKRAVAHSNKGKLGNIARRLHQAEEKLEKVVERLSKKDITGLDESLAEVRSALARVDALNDELQQILASDLSTPEKMKSATEKMREANAALKEVHQLIKELLAKLREAKPAETNV